MPSYFEKFTRLQVLTDSDRLSFLEFTRPSDSARNESETTERL